MRLTSICVEAATLAVYLGALCVTDLETVMTGPTNSKACVVGGEKGVFGMYI